MLELLRILLIIWITVFFRNWWGHTRWVTRWVHYAFRTLPIPFVHIACRFPHDPTHSSHSRTRTENCILSRCPSENDTTQHCQNSHLLKIQHTPRMITPINLRLQQTTKTLQITAKPTTKQHPGYSLHACASVFTFSIKVCKIRLFYNLFAGSCFGVRTSDHRFGPCFGPWTWWPNPTRPINMNIRHVVTFLFNKKRSCRKETVRLLRLSILAKCNWKTIFCGRCNHCDVIGLQCYRIRWNNEVQGHSRSPMSIAIESSCDFPLMINTKLTFYLVPFRSYRRLLYKLWTLYICVFESPFGGLVRETCTVHLRLIGKPAADFLFVLIFFARCYAWDIRGYERIFIGNLRFWRG